MIRAALIGAFALLLGGCGPTVDSVCEDLQRECNVGVVECQADGEQIEDLAEDEGCEDGFEAYLDCIDASGCDTGEACAEIRADLEDCLGAPFPY